MSTVPRFDYDEAWNAAGSEAPDEGYSNSDPWEPPEILTAREVCELPDSNAEHILGELLMEGSRLVIGGKSGEGKTSFVMQVVRAVSQQEEFLGWKGCGGKSLVLDMEQGLRTVKRRLTEVRLDQSDEVDYVRIPDGLALDSDKRQRAWAEDLLLRGDYRLVVLDPLYKAHQGDSNDERAMVDLMRMLDRLRDGQGFALVIPMHLRKIDPRATIITMDDIFGSGGLTRGAEVVLGLRKLHPGRSMLHFWKDRDGDLMEFDKWTLDFSQRTGFERVPEEALTSPEVLIKKALAVAGGELGIKDLAHATQRADKTIRIHVAILEERGEVVARTANRGTKLYWLAPASDDDMLRYERLAGEEGAG